MEIRSRFNVGKKPAGLSCPEAGRTKQSFKDECDINIIMANMATKGILPEMIKQNPQYGDFSNPLEYRDALNIIDHAQQQFQALPSKVRARFENDPATFLEFATNENNLPEMVSLGLAVERVVEGLKKKAKTTPSPASSPAKAEGPKNQPAKAD